MTTTHLFVELLVIGFGALIWFLLLLAGLFGVDIAEIDLKEVPWTALLFPILSLSYVLGILTDRIADWLFEKFWGDKHFNEVYTKNGKTREDYFEDRRTLVVESRELWQFIEYGRSRLRICRGWVLNIVLMGVIFDAYFFLLRLWEAWGDTWFLRLLGLNAILLILGCLCWRGWQRLNIKEYEKIERQAQWLRDHIADKATQEVKLSGRLEMNDSQQSENAEGDDNE